MVSRAFGHRAEYPPPTKAERKSENVFVGAAWGCTGGDHSRLVEFQAQCLRVLWAGFKKRLRELDCVLSGIGLTKGGGNLEPKQPVIQEGH